MNRVELYNELCQRVVQGENERYVPDGTILSLAVYDQVEGQCVDSYFLYMTDFESFSEPYARIALDMSSSQIVRYVTVEEMSFKSEIAVPSQFYESKLFMDYAKAYIDIREFVFQDKLSEENKKKLCEYIESFNRIIKDQFRECYMEMAQHFLEWSNSVL